MKVSIIVPAHNEEKRIKKTVEAYYEFFKKLKDKLDLELVIVLNGCTDSTFDVVNQTKSNINQLDSIVIVVIPDAGKGLAIKIGFENALTRNNDLIGFVDADMATQPQFFYELIEKIENYDGIIASRYMPGAHVYPPRPWFKRLGSLLIYEPIVWLLFGLNYYDFQCGAKLFKRKVIQTITPYLTARQWVFDIELLYLCKKHKFKIKEIPTVWYDQVGSKLRPLRAGLLMLISLFKIRFRH